MTTFSWGLLKAISCIKVNGYDAPEAVAAMMQLAAATWARHWNRRKMHEGSVWEHPYK